jgi:outer membrane protein assembly factor BamE
MRILVNPPHLHFWACLASLLALVACSTVDTASNSFVEKISPYRPEVVQGNFVSREQVALLKPGMSKLQVRQVLGTPLVTSVFHASRWDYVFTLNRQGMPPAQRRLSVFFREDQLERFEGDPMPSEQEFISSISKAPASTAPKKLQATPEDLEKFQQANPATLPIAATTPVPTAATRTYPPLEAEPRQ